MSDRTPTSSSGSGGSAHDDAGPVALLDLAADLLPQLEANGAKPIAAQIAAWQAYYERCAPELPARLYADYRNVEGGWRSIAEHRIFPALPQRLPRMKVALANLHEGCAEVCGKAITMLGLRPPRVVAYVGLGNGAGWATTWEGEHAVLLGLENIAELGWHDAQSVRALLSHELGHLFMTQARQGMPPLADDPLVALYEEGFAQHCEHVLMGRETWHCASQDGWLDWCVGHQRDLAAMYLSVMNDREQRRRFFGSWFDVQGWRQTGYFLGCRFVQHACRAHSIAEVARWPDEAIKADVRAFLEG